VGHPGRAYHARVNDDDAPIAPEHRRPLPPPKPPPGAGDAQELLRRLPQVGQVGETLGAADLAFAPREEWTEELRHAVAEVRAKVLGGGLGPVALGKQTSAPALIAAARKRIERRRDPGLVRVVNATGVVLHTNLGRAALPQAALEALAEHGRGYQLLAADRATGERAPRERHVEQLLQRLTGAEAATVVNNNAAATMLMLASLAAGREVIVSRGQLVEIGGAYRIPEVMRQSGATLVEVGTTNRTHLKDYENAITPRTALLMRVHTSNYRVEGFAGEVAIDDLARLGRAYGVKVVDDLGSGALVSLAAQGLPGEEPLVRASLEAGADLITASGDKLIGGPQMGLLVGSRESVAMARAHPLYRALRADKLRLVALEATLRLFLHPEALGATHPTVAMLTAGRDDLRAAAERLRARLAGLAPVARGAASVAVEDAADAVGAGSLPTVDLPGAAVAVRARDVEAGELARRLRAASVPVFTTVADASVRLHVRTLLPGDEDDVANALTSALASA
jgi:L-seryl-tRNA(Ser) seleniumtransferase